MVKKTKLSLPLLVLLSLPLTSQSSYSSSDLALTAGAAALTVAFGMSLPLFHSEKNHIRVVYATTSGTESASETEREDD